MVVPRFDNDPPNKDVNTVFEWAYKGINDAESDPLLQLILDAEKRNQPIDIAASRAALF